MGKLLVLHIFLSQQSNGTVARSNQRTKNLSLTPIRPPVTPDDLALTITRSLGTPYATNYGDHRLNVWSLIVWDPPVNIWPIRLNDSDRT
jgi:hypothetical protein